MLYTRGFSSHREWQCPLCYYNAIFGHAILKVRVWRPKFPNANVIYNVNMEITCNLNVKSFCTRTFGLNMNLTCSNTNFKMPWHFFGQLSKCLKLRYVFNFDGQFMKTPLLEIVTIISLTRFNEQLKVKIHVFNNELISYT